MSKENIRFFKLVFFLGWTGALATGCDSFNNLVNTPAASRSPALARSSAAERVQFGNYVLNCNLDAAAIPATTDTQSFLGTDTSVSVGITRAYGGVGTSFMIHTPSETIDILEARSAAGAGWQTSTLGLDPGTNRIYVFNQSAGNSLNGQWGFESGFTGLSQNSYVPVFSDHFHDGGSFSGSIYPQSPCTGSSDAVATNNGRAQILGGSQAVGNNHAIVHINNEYSIQATIGQAWSWFKVDQAFYLNLRKASAHNLRVVLVGADHSWSEVVTPQKFKGFNENSHKQASCDASGCGLHSAELNYAALVYTIGGNDVAVIVHRPNFQPFQAQIAVEKTPYCQDASNLDCGNISFHSWVIDGFNPPPGIFAAGQITDYAMSYDVGSLNELSLIGFDVRTALNNTSEGFFTVPNDGRIFYSNGRDAYCAKLTLDDYLNSGGRSDFSNVERLDAAPSSQRFDGPCAVVAWPAGFFQVKGDGTIYYSNGRDAYCAKRSWTEFINSGGQPDMSNVNQRTIYPPGQRSDGYCGLVAQPAGFFQPVGEGTIYYSNGNDAYCAKASWDDYVNSGGRGDLWNVAHPDHRPTQMRDDGVCAPVPQPTGFFQIQGDGTVFYSNGSNAYCSKQSYDDYVNSGGRADFANVAHRSTRPAQRYDGGCAFVSQPVGYFQVRNEGPIYYSNGGDAFCAYPSWDSFLMYGGARDKSNVRQNQDGLPPAMRNDGICGG